MKSVLLLLGVILVLSVIRLASRRDGRAVGTRQQRSVFEAIAIATSARWGLP